MGTEESGEFEPQAAYNETEMYVWEDTAPEDSFEYFSTVERVRSYFLRKPPQPATRLFLPPGNEVCEGYVFTRVCHSVHSGGRAWQGGAWQGVCATHIPQQILRLRHTVNERAVRILLECILVCNGFLTIC